MKPIPPNRRWPGAQQAPPSPVERDLEIAVVNAPQDDLLIEDIALVEEVHIPRVIPARYAGFCRVCQHPIGVGQPIRRHAGLGRWVHAECADREVNLQAPAEASLPTRWAIRARYPGFCRICRNLFPEETQITRAQGYGWVHVECANQLENATA